MPHKNKLDPFADTNPEDIELMAVVTVVDFMGREAMAYIVYDVHLHNLPFALKEMGKEVRTVRSSIMKKGEEVDRRYRYKWQELDAQAGRERVRNWLIIGAGLLFALLLVWLLFYPKQPKANPNNQKPYKPEVILPAKGNRR